MSTRTVGRVLGSLFLLQMVLAPLLNFRLLPPGHRTTFLETAAPAATQLRLAILLMYVLGAITVAVAIIVWPVVRRYSERFGLALVALAILCLVTTALENVVRQQMLVLSLQHAAGDGSALFASLAPWTHESWRQAHYTNVLFGTTFAFLLHLVLLRYALVPRVIAGAGMAAALLAIANAGTPLLGGRLQLGLMAPMGLAQIALMAWLIARGLAEKPAAPAARMGTP